MPRQRKPQNGGQRIGTGRVANTTTGSTTTQAVYRIPTGKKYGECDVRNFEVTGTSPITVAIEGENIYRISLDSSALQQIIEDYPSLDLSNVTLQTVSGDVEFTGNVSVDGIFYGQEVHATSITTTDLDSVNGSIQNFTSSDITATALTAESASLDAVTVTNNATVGGTLDVTGNTSLGGDLSVTGDETVGGTLDVTGAASVGSISAPTGDITTLTSESVTTDTLVVNQTAQVDGGLTVTNGIATDTLETSGAASIGGNLAVTGNTTVDGTSTFTGNVTVDNITSTGTANLNNVAVAGNETVAGTLAVTGATTINDNLTVAGASTLSGNTSVGGNLSVAGNSTVTGNQTVTGDAIFSEDITVGKDLVVSGDANFADEITVGGIAHLDDVHATGDVTVDETLNVGGAINGGNGLTVTGQIESDTVRTGEVVADEVRVTEGLYLSNGAEAPAFVLQAEKGQPNGVAGLDANGQIDNSMLPPVYTSAIVKLGTGAFSNSDTAVVVDNDIKADSFVIISNYQDILGDLNETISPGQLTVVSNQTETGSFKYIVVNALPQS